MKLVIQRVSNASVTVDGAVVGAIGQGLLVLGAVMHDDGPDDLRWASEKLVHLRIFPDEDDRMNRSVQEIGGGLLLVSNFTVAGDCGRGRRPSFEPAMKPPEAERMFDAFIELVRLQHDIVATGRFGAHMDIALVNDGPVTIVLDSKERGRSSSTR